jgi:hypothetical protein
MNTDRRHSASPILSCLVLLGMTVAVGLPARGQTNVERFQRQLEQIEREATLRATTEVPVGRRAIVDYGGSLSLNYFSLDDPVANNHALMQYELLGYGRLNIDGAHEFFVRGRTTWLNFSHGDSFDGEGNHFESAIDRAYYRLDLRRAAMGRGEKMQGDIIVQGGRQLVYWANGLTLAQVLDGVTLNFSHGPLRLDMLAGMTPARAIDIDISRPSFDDSTHRGFYGAMLSAQMGQQRPYIYALVQKDYNHRESVLSQGAVTRFGYDSVYVGVGSTGSLTDHLLCAAEIVYEGGRGLSAPGVNSSGGIIKTASQTTEDIRAAAGDVRFDYVPGGAWRQRWSLELLAASGDIDRRHTTNTVGGNRSGTSDNAFNGFGLINTGLAFAPRTSNIWMARVGGSGFPLSGTKAFAEFQVGADLFLFGKTNSQAPIDQSSGRGGFLGVEPDLFVNWEIATDITLALRYGIFIPSDHEFASNSGRQFVFAGVTFAF